MKKYFWSTLLLLSLFCTPFTLLHAHHHTYTVHLEEGKALDITAANPENLLQDHIRVECSLKPLGHDLYLNVKIKDGRGTLTCKELGLEQTLHNGESASQFVAGNVDKIAFKLSTYRGSKMSLTAKAAQPSEDIDNNNFASVTCSFR